MSTKTGSLFSLSDTNFASGTAWQVRPLPTLLKHPQPASQNNQLSYQCKLSTTVINEKQATGSFLCQGWCVPGGRMDDEQMLEKLWQGGDGAMVEYVGASKTLLYLVVSGASRGL